MKIIVIDEIIDTDDILRISSIKQGEEVFSYRFIISRYNKDDFHVGKSLSEYYRNHEDYIKAGSESLISNHELLKESIRNLREEVLKYWLDNQIKIPKLEFK